MRAEQRHRWALSSDGSRSRPGGPEPYTDADGRTDPDDCNHTQYLDMQQSTLEAGPARGRCLDCGAVVIYQSWLVDSSQPALSDQDLRTQRQVHRAVWFSGLEFPAGASFGR